MADDVFGYRNELEDIITEPIVVNNYTFYNPEATLKEAVNSTKFKMKIEEFTFKGEDYVNGDLQFGKKVQFSKDNLSRLKWYYQEVVSS